MDGGSGQEGMAERIKHEVKDNKEKVHRRPGDRKGLEPCPETSTIRHQNGPDCTLTCKDAGKIRAFRRSDTILSMFYLENLLPFLFPFYRPSILQGGRAWILEMMMSSPTVLHTTLCQSSYFFSLARGTTEGAWETVLTQTRDAFGVLSQALQIIDGPETTEHLHGAVRVMASIIQLQRFETAVVSFENCQAHLNVALALFRQLHHGPGGLGSGDASLNFHNVINLLGPPSWVLPAQCVEVRSAEQAAFCFSLALLILDDIIASTYHRDLLNNIDDMNPLTNLEGVVGCQNWALLQIGEIAVLDAWKQKCKRAGDLDVVELVHRAKAIKDLLEAHLIWLETTPVMPKRVQSRTTTSQSSLVTQVWAHAALLYLSVVVSGWQPANIEVHYHPAQEAHMRRMVEVLQPPSVFGPARKAPEIMESVHDLAMCF
ncbi:fungal-specific transcription factor domain-containing protein [Tricladium varicosporioides]|nr:fungal-specific transcription factor domain-containing protein [Hymenoscyphus varicosporioides]